jgi:hypothetical protein
MAIPRNIEGSEHLQMDMKTYQYQTKTPLFLLRLFWRRQKRRGIWQEEAGSPHWGKMCSHGTS